MQVSSTGSTTSSTSTNSTAAATSSVAAAQNTVNYSSFLNLLVQQLKDQDPTAPSDPTTFVSELASFSNVEQQTQTNTKLDALLTSNALTQAESVIGRTVSSASGDTSGKVVSVALGSNGTTTATLDSGSTLALGDGVTVSGT
jgi:flagellar basal-body rod modification protein FlgD